MRLSIESPSLWAHKERYLGEKIAPPRSLPSGEGQDEGEMVRTNRSPEKGVELNRMQKSAALPGSIPVNDGGS
jgi:hypothetical protein